MLPTADLDYHLPDQLIATHPAHRRDEAKLMLLSRTDPSYLEHRIISDLPEILHKNDFLVVNDTRVLPARLIGTRLDTGGKTEGLYLDSPEPNIWHMMLKSGGKLKPGLQLQFTSADNKYQLQMQLLEKQNALWTVKIKNTSTENPQSNQTAQNLLEQIGRTPLPPYIIKQRKNRNENIISEQEDKKRYQTIYAGPRAGAVAAPTAGLHFTDNLLNRCHARGMNHAAITLHVGAGTFKPVETEYLENHPMHEEAFSISPTVIQQLKTQRQQHQNNQSRLIAVGTTTVRALESLPAPDQLSEEILQKGITKNTNLLISPGFNFNYTDILLTNFHLPKSTLLALVGAFLGNLDKLKSAYQIAIKNNYRFYSYGDAMLILP